MAWISLGSVEIGTYFWSPSSNDWENSEALALQKGHVCLLALLLLWQAPNLIVYHQMMFYAAHRAGSILQSQVNSVPSQNKVRNTCWISYIPVH